MSLKRQPFKFDELARIPFLRALREVGSVALAAQIVDISIKTIERHRTSDPEFNRFCETAMAYYHLTNDWRDRIGIREKAMKEIARRIEAGTASDMLLLRAVEEIEP